MILVPEKCIESGHKYATCSQATLVVAGNPWGDHFGVQVQQGLLPASEAPLANVSRGAESRRRDLAGVTPGPAAMQSQPAAIH